MPLRGNGSLNCWRALGEACLDNDPFGDAVHETVDVFAGFRIVTNDKAEYEAVAGEHVSGGASWDMTRDDAEGLVRILCVATNLEWMAFRRLSTGLSVPLQRCSTDVTGCRDAQ